jgi:hypothetical protein
MYSGVDQAPRAYTPRNNPNPVKQLSTFRDATSSGLVLAQTLKAFGVVRPKVAQPNLAG